MYIMEFTDYSCMSNWNLIFISVCTL